MEEVEFNFDAIRSPIHGEVKTGSDLRQDASPQSPYFSLKEIRNRARAAERKALVDGEDLSSFAKEWLPILNQVPEQLYTSTKDLELSAWLIEASCRIHGFSGLSKSFEVAAILIETFWEGIYPLPDEDGVETCVAPLTGLNGIDGEGALLMPISSIPLTEEGEHGPYSLWQVEQALEVDRLDEEKKRAKLDAGATSLDEVMDCAKSSSQAFFVSTKTSIEQALLAFKRLSDAMDSACQSPQPTSQIQKRLQNALDSIIYLAGDKLNILSESDTDQHALVNESACADAPVSSDTLASRKQAIMTLRQVAEFFKNTEPHSPMAYGIEQVIRWSDMSLPELLNELITDGDARNGYFRLTGIPVE
ncbi:type VI secretion system protein TssA [Corallincola platygyrae]|uniref:Type VI secretion system protein TssA n=1 Tax=Corallincola platygyrae TaxID=1193278 RepID=A0ABW4XKP8_9GAMM